MIRVCNFRESKYRLRRLFCGASNGAAVSIQENFKMIYTSALVYNSKQYKTDRKNHIKKQTRYRGWEHRDSFF